MYKFSNSSIEKLKGLHPRLVEFANKLLKVSPYDFCITQGIRSVEEQQKLYAQGRTLPGSKVTNCDGIKYKSNHQVHDDGLGYAFDIAILIGNKINWDSKNYIKVGNAAMEIMKKYNVEWGGNWKSFKDYPHFELKNKEESYD